MTASKQSDIDRFSDSITHDVLSSNIRELANRATASSGSPHYLEAYAKGAAYLADALKQFAAYVQIRDQTQRAAVADVAQSHPQRSSPEQPSPAKTDPPTEP